jgi:hypothetical protein
MRIIHVSPLSLPTVPAFSQADVAGSTRALLMTTHVVAAAIVVPALARRLPYGPDGRLQTPSGRSHPC